MRLLMLLALLLAFVEGVKLSPAPLLRRVAAATLAAATVLSPPSSSLAALNDNQALVAEVWRTVDKDYYDRTFNGVDWFALRQAKIAEAGKSKASSPAPIIKDMLKQLGDRYTRYLSPEKYATIVQSASGELAGIGVTISTEGNQPVVIEVEPNTPASEVGLQPGDAFIAISGQEVAGYEPDECAALLRGPAGTKVGVLAQRGGEKLDLIITRKQFKIQSVVASSGRAGLRRTGEVRIKSFSSTTAADVSAALASLKKSGMDMAIVDLRGNVGGLLPGGVDTARLFLEEGKDIVTVISKKGILTTYQTLQDGPFKDLPLAVLVDGKTASASEVFAAAIKENERAKMSGARTFGKGVIQTVEPLSNEGGVAVTVAAYRTPKGNDINKVGIPVDYEVDCPLSKQASMCVE
ncbi:unnamed protein product [Chrysoparadoxa australica]